MSGYDNASETIRKTAVSTTLTNNDYNLLVLGATGAVTITLPLSASIQPGRPYKLYKDAAAQTVTVTPSGSDTFPDGAVTLASGARHGAEILTDGLGNWYLVDSF